MRFLTQASVFLSILAAASCTYAAAILPADAKYSVTVTTERTEYILGENVRVTFSLENTGLVEFTADFGGDYRGGTRANRFKVTASDSNGQKADDPDPDQRHFGGLVRPAKLGPGQKSAEKISLTRYCRITQPGTYVIRVGHDCGWKLAEGSIPAGGTKIVFRLPTAKEAEAIVAKIAEGTVKEKLPNGYKSWSDIASLHEWSDFASLQAPVYLPALLHLAGTGNVEALPGIGSIATSDATAALIQLASESDTKFALQAAAVLRQRLPDLVYPNRPQQPTAQARLAAKAWDDRFRPAAIDLARKWLVQTDPALIAAGAGILRSLGNNDDAAALCDALDRTIKSQTIPRETYTGNYPQPVQGLLEALVGLRTRGLTLTATTMGSDGSKLAYLDSFRAKQTRRPPGWHQIFESACASPCVILREAAIRSLVYPVPAECADLVAALKSDPDAGIEAAILFATERKVINRPPPGAPKSMPAQVIDIPAEPLQTEGSK